VAADPAGVAVVGLGALFPGAPDAAAFWDNIAAGRDAVREASPHRVDPRFCDPASAAVDRLPTRRGGFLGDEVPFDASRFGIMPVAVPGTEPDQLLALQVAAAALADAGIDTADLGGCTVGVILGRGGYLTPAMTRLGRRARDAEQLSAILRQVLPGLPEADVERVKDAFSASAGLHGPEAAIGVVPNLTASRIANRLDLHGPAYTLDAACASSLLAVEHAIRELRSGRCDLVLAGGVHLVDDVPFWSVFSQLGAISRAGTIRPFDRRADGLLIGEGIGILALKRLDRAQRDGDRIYAVLRGVGSSSDGRAATVMVPRSAGQVLALRRAWADAGLDPRGVGLIEAHGTATPTGDAAELATLDEVFGRDGAPVGLGSVKSMIGHAMPAAGAAGLIKAVLAVHHGVIPPSLHCEEPHEALARSRFEVSGASRPWDDGDRLAGVNAFGFGGINAHVVVGSHGAAARTAGRRAASNPVDRADADVLAIAAADPDALLALLERGVRRGGAGPCRLGLIDPTPERIARARRVVERGAPWSGRGGMWFRREGLIDAGGGVVFVFPGIEASFSPETETVCARYGYAPVPLPSSTDDLEVVGEGVVRLGRFLDRVLRDLGVQPALYAGHSVGEWTGMVASGRISDIDGFLTRIPFRSLRVPDVLFAAAGCGIDVARAAIVGLEGIAVSHDNCPHQVILCGHTDAIAVARERLLAEGVLCQVLPFRSGFHSPLFADYVAPHRANLDALELGVPHTPLWSATTVSPYPDDPAEVRDLVLEHLVAPLRFRELVETLYGAGARVFVQLGVGSVAGFVSDTLGARPHLAIAAAEDRRSGLAQLRNLLLALFVEGAGVDPLAASPSARARVPVSLGVPMVTLDVAPLTLQTAPRDPVLRDPLMAAALAEAEEALLQGPRDVLRALVSAGRSRPWRTTRHLSVERAPALRDHAFFPQPAGWPVAADGRPVVPMTMTIQLLVEAAEAAHPGQVVVELAELRALRWVAVEPPVDVRIEGEVDLTDPGDGAEWVRVRLDDADGSGLYAEARLRLAPGYPDPPAPTIPALVAPAPAPQTAAEMYAQRWMFHGPAYQGVARIDGLGEGGVDGELVSLPAPGALLDSAGQLLGYWLVATHPADALTMPTGLERLRLYGPHPAPGTAVRCRARATDLRPQLLSAALELEVGGRVWCRIDGWADHRFEADQTMVLLMRQPERTLLSDDHGGVTWFDDQQHRTPSRDWLGRRYLGQDEREALLEAGPRVQRQLLDDRVAAKDAVRRLLWGRGEGPIFPVEVAISGMAPGAHHLEAVVRGSERVLVAVDHAGSCSAAVASAAGRPGVAIGAAGDDEALVRIAAARALGADPAGLGVEQGGGGYLVDGLRVALIGVGDRRVAFTVG
jgi:acyl transferase domain-containing protein